MHATLLLTNLLELLAIPLTFFFFTSIKLVRNMSFVIEICLLLLLYKTLILSKKMKLFLFLKSQLIKRLYSEVGKTKFLNFR